MEAVRQSCRPKHQILILKCYPKLQKNAVDVKPNSSELSYLLYYASTRRTKVQKVGVFLEKRTASDVWKGRIGYVSCNLLWGIGKLITRPCRNVQVTLQILKALIEKSPRDLPLYASSVLKILNSILRSSDLTMVENSIPTFETLCAHHNESFISADQDYLVQYEGIVRRYASFASEPPVQAKDPTSTPVGMRWRSIGLQAIKSIASADALGSDPGKQLGIILPVILKNLYSDSEDHLLVLQQRAQFADQADVERTLRPRLSIATVRTADTGGGDAAAIARTTADADKLDEEDIGVLALRSLKKIFEVNNRGQIRSATGAVLKFITNHVPQESVLDLNASIGSNGAWSTTLIEMLARWAPVQDRYIIMVTAMETLLKSPMAEDKLNEQLTLATLISWLLSSNVNLIGLSVMDILLGLVQQILLLLQLGGSKLNTVVQHELQGHNGPEAVPKVALETPSSSSTSVNAAATEVVMKPSLLRKDLIKRLRICIGDLATHIYYSDQVSDMVSAILLRLKPGVCTTAPATEDSSAAANAASISANAQENPNTDAFFSFSTARLEALKAIKEILRVANNRSVSGVAAVGRHRVGVQVWDATQWLLRDDDAGVRMAYVDALLTWLRLEIGRDGLRASEDKSFVSKPGVRPGEDLSSASLVRRAVSNSTSRERGLKPGKSHFLQLLHLAVYENALQYAGVEGDILLLHLLLANLVEKLGINAASSGLPMIVRLQEDIQVVENPTCKIRIGSLVHGYFWALSEKFDFETSFVGKEIQAEIRRRKDKGMWVERIRMPPVPIDQLKSTGQPTLDEVFIPKVETESLRPFDNRAAMVDRIAMGYSSSISSPPSSPPSSPGRVFSLPIFPSVPSPHTNATNHLPVIVKERMLTDWNKEVIVTSTDPGGSKSASLNGSRTGTNPSGTRNFLAVNGLTTNGGGGTGTHTPLHSHSHHSHHQASSAYGLVGGTGIGALQRSRLGSAQDGSPTARTSSSRSSTVRVDELKRVLSGMGSGTASAIRGRDFTSPDTSSESMISYDFPPSEYSDAVGVAELTPTATTQKEPRPTNSANIEPNEQDDKIIPPVPPLPTSLSIPGGYPEGGTPSGSTTNLDRQQPSALNKNTSSPEYRRSRSLKRKKSRGGRSTSRGAADVSSGGHGENIWGAAARGGRGGGGGDLSGLLKGIDVSCEDGGIAGKGFGKPPY
ncbi:MAG: plasma membrane localization protein [Trichoglossum hirsutum]|nr:MAG: plasma membrane localization protein [Trichoglossum hirsutum]